MTVELSLVNPVYYDEEVRVCAWNYLKSFSNRDSLKNILKLHKKVWMDWRGQNGETLAHHVALYMPEHLDQLFARKECPENFKETTDNNNCDVTSWWLAGKGLASEYCSISAYDIKGIKSLKRIHRDEDGARLSIQCLLVVSALREKKLIQRFSAKPTIQNIETLGSNYLEACANSPRESRKKDVEYAMPVALNSLISKKNENIESFGEVIVKQKLIDLYTGSDRFSRNTVGTVINSSIVTAYKNMVYAYGDEYRGNDTMKKLNIISRINSCNFRPEMLDDIISVGWDPRSTVKEAAFCYSKEKKEWNEMILKPWLLWDEKRRLVQSIGVPLISNKQKQNIL